jgi:hypothetical protein
MPSASASGSCGGQSGGRKRKSGKKGKGKPKVIRTGPEGGKFYVKNGRKIYV